MVMSEIFWTSFYTGAMAFCLGIISFLYKSKCKEVECCCIKIIRDVEIEEKEMEIINKINREEKSTESL
jgi:hypothetical protein